MVLLDAIALPVGQHQNQAQASPRAQGTQHLEGLMEVLQRVGGKHDVPLLRHGRISLPVQPVGLDEPNGWMTLAGLLHRRGRKVHPAELPRLDPRGQLVGAVALGATQSTTDSCCSPIARNSQAGRLSIATREKKRDCCGPCLSSQSVAKRPSQ
jgi:hypothetical protein